MSEPIALLISDMDGTLLTPQKGLSQATIEAVQRLASAGIGFTVISSRPPRGMAAVVKQLGVRLPFAAFNGGSVVGPDMRVLAAQHLAPGCARQAIALLQAAAVGTWVFADDQWLLTDPLGYRLQRERHTLGFDPITVTAFDHVIDRIEKIMGVSEHPEPLAALEGAIHAALGAQVHADCSNPYYLDITPPDANKGAGVQALCARIGIPTTATAVIGDMSNDVPMFHIAGLAIAMGQAPAAVRASAHRTTLSNAEDGFASAITRIIMPTDEASRLAARLA
jgi:Cof subfamily protein (haloacid dehalogenase superfamily)